MNTFAATVLASQPFSPSVLKDRSITPYPVIGFLRIQPRLDTLSFTFRTRHHRSLYVASSLLCGTIFIAKAMSHSPHLPHLISQPFPAGLTQSRWPQIGPDHALLTVHIEHCEIIVNTLAGSFSASRPFSFAVCKDCAISLYPVIGFLRNRFRIDILSLIFRSRHSRSFYEVSSLLYGKIFIAMAMTHSPPPSPPHISLLSRSFDSISESMDSSGLGAPVWRSRHRKSNVNTLAAPFLASIAFSPTVCIDHPISPHSPIGFLRNHFVLDVLSVTFQSVTYTP